MYLELEITLGHQFNLPFPFGAYRSLAYHSSFGAKHSRLSFGAYQLRIHQSHQKFSTAILDCTTTILRLSTINRRAGFIKNSSRKKKKNTLNHEMKICFFQIFKSSFSQSFLTMASSFSTLSNQYCFIISLKSTLSWFSRNPPHNIIIVLRSKKILFLYLTITFVHKITHNKVCIVLPCFCGFGWPGNPSLAETPVPNLRVPVVSFQLLGLLAEAVVRNKHELGWFLRLESQVSSIFHFSVLFQQVAVGENGKKCWGILQIVFHPTLETNSKAPPYQNSTFGVGKWSPKLHSMFP